MGRAALASGALHLTVILILVIGLPSFVNTPEALPPIPVELVELEDLEKKPTPKPKPKPEPEKKPEPEPEPPKQEAKLPPTPPTPEPAPEPEPVPEQVEAPPEPEPVPEPPKPEAKPEAEEKTEPAPPEPPRKPDLKVAMADRKKQAEPPEDRLTSILRNVEKLKQQQASKPAPSDESQSAAQPVRTSQLELNALARSIQQQMSRCWRLEPGARDAEDLVVEIQVVLNRDGSVRGQPRIIDSNRMARDAFYRSAAENARRAILRCQPFDLPIKRYEVWRDMTLKFDPRSMFGG